MGCRTHKWRSHSVEPNVSGKRLTLRLKSVKSEDINALRDNLPLNYDSDSEEGFDEPVSVKDMFIASQIVRCAPKDHYPAVRIRHLERKYRRKEFRLPKLQCMDLMVSMTQMSEFQIQGLIDWSELWLTDQNCMMVAFPTLSLQTCWCIYTSQLGDAEFHFYVSTYLVVTWASLRNDMKKQKFLSRNLQDSFIWFVNLMTVKCRKSQHWVYLFIW